MLEEPVRARRPRITAKNPECVHAGLSVSRHVVCPVSTDPCLALTPPPPLSRFRLTPRLETEGREYGHVGMARSLQAVVARGACGPMGREHMFRATVSRRALPPVPTISAALCDLCFTQQTSTRQTSSPIFQASKVVSCYSTHATQPLSTVAHKRPTFSIHLSNPAHTPVSPTLKEAASLLRWRYTHHAPVSQMAGNNSSAGLPVVALSDPAPPLSMGSCWRHVR